MAHVAEIQDGNGQCGTFGGIGSGAQLIKETQALTVDPSENIHYGLHVGGEGGQTLFDALLVADICEHLPEEREFTPVSRRNMQSRHAHQLEQTHCLERDRLASGVGSGDDDHIVVGTQFDIDGNDLFGVDQGMTAVADVDVVFIVENRPGGILLHGQISAGKDEIQLGHVPGVVFQLHEVFTSLG